MDRQGEGSSVLPKIANKKSEEQRYDEKTDLFCDCFSFCCEAAIETAMLRTIDRVIDNTTEEQTGDTSELDHLISTAARTLPLLKVTKVVCQINDHLNQMIIKYGTDPELPPKLVTELFKEVEKLSYTIIKWKQKLVVQQEQSN